MSGQKPLQEGCFYHIFNRGNNRENIFLEPRNYEYFLHLYARHIEPVAATYAYCLLHNHFHLLVRINPSTPDHRIGYSGKPPAQAFSNFFNAYARTINQTYGRTGSLFQRPFKRVSIRSQAQLCSVVIYIHQNPQKHGFVEDFSEWSHSSYPACLSEGPPWLDRQEVISWFGGKEGFIEAHCRVHAERVTLPLVREDD
jgi:REP element-mobilizing transposase RayT